MVLEDQLAVVELVVLALALEVPGLDEFLVLGGKGVDRHVEGLAVHHEAGLAILHVDQFGFDLLAGAVGEGADLARLKGGEGGSKEAEARGEGNESSGVHGAILDDGPGPGQRERKGRVLAPPHAIRLWRQSIA